MVLNQHPANYLATWSVAILGIFVSMIVGYWLVVQQAPISNIKLTVENPYAWPGGWFTVNHEFDGKANCPHYTTYTLTDKIGNSFNVVSNTRRTPGLYKINVPKDIAAGMAIYNETIHFKCNPLKEIVVASPEIKFYVVQ